MTREVTVAELEENRRLASSQLARGVWPPDACPSCGRVGVQYHSKSAWCHRCGWGQNRRVEGGRP